MKQKRVIAPDPPLSAGLRLFLYVTALVTGAAIMVVEILGAKMLSPYVGLSHFVWTAQIAVTLVALACGYYVGGKLANKSQHLSRLYWAIHAAGYLTVTVLICEPVAYWALDLSLPVGSLLASAILFFVPLAMLAMTGPYLVRVITSSVSGLGANVGRLTSVSTLGSFAGTLCIGYLMIPLLPNWVTMYLTAVMLFVVCAFYFLRFYRKGLIPVALVALVGIGSGMALRQPHDYRWVNEVFEGNSNFGKLQVFDQREGQSRFYLNDNLIQNTYDKATKQSESAFTYLLAGLARAYTTNIHDVLCIGLGVGIVPMDFTQRAARVDVVEINPAVVPVAMRFFDLQTNRIHLTVDDGRHYLNRCHQLYDVIVPDAFLGDSYPYSPAHSTSLSKHASRAPAGGNLVINSFGHLDEGQDFFAASLNQTLKSVFKSVRMHSSGGAVFFAASRPDGPGLCPHARFVQRSFRSS